MRDTELQKIDEQIIPIVNTNKCILWIGAGFSKPSGYSLGWEK